MSNLTVTQTHWAARDIEQHERLVASLPAVLATQFSDWQERVDASPKIGHLSGVYAYLVPIVATEYAKREDGVFAPVAGTDRTYLVTTDMPHKAHDIVTAYLAEQAPGKSFSTSTGSSTMILREPAKD